MKNLMAEIANSLNELLVQIGGIHKRLLENNRGSVLSDTELRLATSQLHEKIAMIQSLRNESLERDNAELDHLLSTVEEQLSRTLDLTREGTKTVIHRH